MKRTVALLLAAIISCLVSTGTGHAQLPCTVTINSPANNATLQGVVPISVASTCAPGGPAIFYRAYLEGVTRDFSGSFLLDTTALPDGPDSITVIAWDRTGLIEEGVSAQVFFTIANQAAPTPTLAATASPTPAPQATATPIRQATRCFPLWTSPSDALHATTVSGVVTMAFTPNCDGAFAYSELFIGCPDSPIVGGRSCGADYPFFHFREGSSSSFSLDTTQLPNLTFDLAVGLYNSSGQLLGSVHAAGPSGTDGDLVLTIDN